MEDVRSNRKERTLRNSRLGALERTRSDRKGFERGTNDDGARDRNGVIEGSNVSEQRSRSNGAIEERRLFEAICLAMVERKEGTICSVVSCRSKL